MSQVFNIDPESPNPQLIDESVAILKKGGIVAYPTETFYGLGVDVTQEQAIKRLYDLKRRDYSSPIAVITADVATLHHYVQEVSSQAERLMEAFWPGPLTILFKANERISKSLTTNTGKIGIRVSSNPIALSIAKGLGCPVTTTSANLSGLPPSFSLKHLNNYFGEKIDLIIDGGELAPSRGSTVVDVSEDKLVIIREGDIPAESLFECFEE